MFSMEISEEMEGQKHILDITLRWLFLIKVVVNDDTNQK